MGCAVSIFGDLRVYVASGSTAATTGDISYSSSIHFLNLPSFTEARSRFEADKLDGTALELRCLLDYPIARQSFIGQLPLYAPFIELCFFGWLDIQSFNEMSDKTTKITMAYSIRDKYFQNNSLISESEASIVEKALGFPNDSLIVSGMFSSTESRFFALLHDFMFVKFRQTPDYQLMCKALRRKYNRVKQKDFAYCQMIGTGGFGLVCEVIKRSTGTRYAMKLQRKSHLVNNFGEETWRADMEKQAIASCHHPFIVELFFAFQTKTMVAMVMTMCTGRDLSRILRSHGRFSREQVTFYAAEVTSALSYLHGKGFIYRDLKPANVVLNLDGHIMLVDFGGVCDMHGQTLGKICRLLLLWALRIYSIMLLLFALILFVMCTPFCLYYYYVYHRIFFPRIV